MPVKINELEIENVKRVKAVKLTPTESGLTIIGGDNGQGKTSVLDAIAWVLGGDKYKPSNPYREGSVIPPNLHISLSNGLVVERTGKNSTLKVTDPGGNKSGQQLLNEFVETFALDLPKFMGSSNKEKANTLLQIIGVGDKLHQLEDQEQRCYNERLAIGRIADQKKKYANEMEYFDGVPKDIISVSDLIKQQQEILAKNGENQRKRDRLGGLETEAQRVRNEIHALHEKLDKLIAEENQLISDIAIAKKSASELQDASTAELENNILQIEAINNKVRCNLNKEKAEDDAKLYEAQYATLTTLIEDMRKAKTDLLQGANLPLQGLSVENGELIFNGFKWDNMSGSEQLKVATAIVRKINPNCGFVLLDKLEQMDTKTINEFAQWAEQEGLQVIATRVSKGEECSIVIEDGYVIGQPVQEAPAKKWKEGEF
ncbi:ATP-binding protein [Anaerotignum sp.]|uniref:ATP-binding protein n=1 Tax=Anaerotignum sp. TaxID=2039241 RepID=UPI00289C83AE|nr:AAA family ATPase [Anaerotignum sp.]